MARKNNGIILLLIGCLLLLIACGWYIYNIVEDNHAGMIAEEILNKFDAKQKDTAEINNSVIIVEGDAFCGKIIIENLSIELPVYDEWDYTRLKLAPCRYTGKIDTNDMIIAAHNYKSHFGLLNMLAIGDEIEFIDVYEKSHLYEVCELITLDGSAVSDMKSGDCDFTLFTCTISGEQRVTVRCKAKG